MKVFRIQIVKHNKKSTEVLHEVFVKSNLGEQDLSSAYYKRFTPLSVQVTEVTEIDSFIVKNVFVEEHNIYADYPSHTIEYSAETHPKLAKKAEAYKKAEEKLQELKKDIQEYFTDYINNPTLKNVNEKSIYINGYFKQNIIKEK